jgi:lactoylglutathione lyase
MLRVSDLAVSLDFYTNTLGMRLLRREDYPDGEFTLAFLGYGDESNNTVLELTYNWGANSYSHGTYFGHLAIGVSDLNKTCEQLRTAGVKFLREPDPMKFHSLGKESGDVIAFIEDPNGYKIELIEKAD